MESTQNKTWNTWGGKREGAGRRKSDTPSKAKATKVIRVSESEAALVKSGQYKQLLELVRQYKASYETTKGAKTSPRWQRMREFLAKTEEFLDSKRQA
ncbi:MAG: hypothetical protein AAFQ80_05435 [Cyanobacteria bacterium J06621_8]